MPARSAFFKRPIVGTENEYDVNDRRGLITQPHVIAAMMRRTAKFGHRVNPTKLKALSAALYYQEVSNKCEHAGPECTNGYDVMVHEWAGGLFWALMAWYADQENGRDSPMTWMLKTNTSHNGVSSGGSHISVGLPSYGREFHENIERLMPLVKAFIVTLPVLFGAGVVLPRHLKACKLEGTNWRFAIAARGMHVTHDLGTANTVTEAGDKPIFQNRKEALADWHRFWRLQISGLDSNILPASIQLKIDLVQLICEMAVRAMLDPIILWEREENACDTMKMVSMNWRIQLPVEGVRGVRSMTPREIQLHYFRQAEKYLGDNPGRYRSLVLEHWSEMLEALDTEDDVPEGNYGKSDWVTKYLMLRQWDQRAEEPMTYGQAEFRHFAYHGYRLSRKGACMPVRLMRQFGPPGITGQVVRALREPPDDTRAWGVGQAIRLRPRGLEVAWESLKADDTQRIKLGDPHIPATELLMAQLARWARRRGVRPDWLEGE